MRLARTLIEFTAPAGQTTRMKPRILPAFLLISALALLINACSSGHYVNRDGAPSRPVDVSNVPDAVPRLESPSRYGNPASYEVAGKRYYPMKASGNFVEKGIASWYGTKFHGRRTSSGEPYDMYAMTAAHKTLPLPTYVQVTNLNNGRQVVVKVNDRGPFHDNRIIDLSYAAASKLGILGTGTGLVEIRAIDPRAPDTIMAKAPVRSSINPSPISTAHAEPVPNQPGMFLQVGAFASRTNAERLRADLQKASLGKVLISTVNGLSGPVYRVRIGPLASVEEADRMVESLSQYSVGTPHVVID